MLSEVPAPKDGTDWKTLWNEQTFSNVFFSYTHFLHCISWSVSVNQTQKPIRKAWALALTCLRVTLVFENNEHF